MAENVMREIKEYFSTPEKPLENIELIELKKKDPEGFQQIKEGLLDGAMTY